MTLPTPETPGYHHDRTGVLPEHRGAVALTLLVRLANTRTDDGEHLMRTRIAALGDVSVETWSGGTLDGYVWRLSFPERLWDRVAALLRDVATLEA